MRFRFLLFAALLLAPLPAAASVAQWPETLPDIDVLYIERTPRYPGYRLDYDRPGQQGVPILVDNKTKQPLTPEQAARVKRWPAAGETVTFTAHVQNRGNGTAAPYEYAWYVDGAQTSRGIAKEPQRVGQEATFIWQWKWQPGRHTIKYVADPLHKVREQSLDNNSREDATDAWTLIWAVDRHVYDEFNRLRNFTGTRSFEDWAQWHIDWMNHLFDISPTPWDGPGGSGQYAVARSERQAASGKSIRNPKSEIRNLVRPRIRCDGVVVVDNVDGVWDRVLGQGVAPLDAGYDGAWPFGRREDCTEWAANVDWGLIHEWGHQLGLTDEYALDRAGFLNEVADETGDPLLIGHLSSQKGYMMQGHGPTTFSPECMGALMTQFGRRRGYYGDYYYNIPERNYLRVLDNRGRPVPGAKVSFWQDQDTHYAGAPVLEGITNSEGLCALPNRPAPHITTDRGYTQHDNPFGKINVVGPGDVFFIRIRARGQTDYTWLDIAELNLAYWSTGPVRAVYSRSTHIPAAATPATPAGLAAEVSSGKARLTWKAVAGATGYRVYHARPDEYRYEPVDASFIDGTSATVPLGNGALHRFAVVALDGSGRESAFSHEVGVMNLVRPWGIAVRRDGKRYIRDGQYESTVLQKPDGSFVGLVGSVHYHFEGSYDIALDSKGRLVSAKMGDGYDPKPGFRVQDEKLNLVVDYRKPEGSAPGQVRKPMGVGVDSKDHIFIADTGNDRIQEFTPDGAFVQVIGAEELRAPMKVAFDGEDRMYVADSGSNRIAVFEKNAAGSYRLLKTLAIQDPCYVMVDPRGRIFVSTMKSPGVYMFSGLDAPGAPSWEYHGTEQEPLSGPRGLALDGNGNLLIVDELGRRVRSVKLP